MPIFWAMAFAGVVMIIAGVWQLVTPLDDLWARQERALLARGLAPQRTDAWERSTRMGGGVMVGVGIVVLLFILMLQASVPPKMSGVSIDGHELTQQEWDDCHHNDIACVTMYANGQH
jgi:uncharacterized membrane protein HdeD (DUF308 family)